MRVRWRDAMARALYGAGGFFVAAGSEPAGHFRTSVHASPLFTEALLRLLDRVDAALGHPERLDVVDVGAGRGELLARLAGQAPAPLAGRLRLTAVELAPRPDDLPPAIAWRSDTPTELTGLLLATEWLDNVPLDVATDGRYLLVDPETGDEGPGPRLDAADAAWAREWWPAPPQDRVEIGRARDDAWAGAVAALRRGLALTVDYGHVRAERPAGGTLTGYRHGRQVPPVPDGSCDVTAHVALDSVAAAGAAAADGAPYTLLSQRAALHALGIDGRRPPLALAGTDPAGYLRALAAATAAAELTDPAGLGAHRWLLQPVRAQLDGLLG
ncbi:SAM-dependent methyltransferase, MidA family [Micromonospora pattaloongensis]|uniref:SAM-dependent methyltransferase, MidA family n=1 Tax=Micromonospora pattaloongensis TaxID=405436 RepID=A0A1H3H893_9ACTN|nr:SAM-dependent methyltransferase [Micromonospora pattaloongensis]SDY11793.1 SAM-dependent methyltransferase, MidA family [Micromonospora pattaloongensis]